MNGVIAMLQRTRRPRLIAFGICLLALALAACGGSSSPTNTPAPAAGAIPNSFVGAVPDSDAFIALTTTSGASLSYVCDSKQIATWFKGAVAGNAVDLTAANGNHLKATLTATGASGTVTLAGKDFPFTAAPATGDSGLFRAEQTASDGGNVVGGWILTADGQQRGSINKPNGNRDEFTPAPQLVVAQRVPNNTFTVNHPTFGPLTVKPVVDRDDHRG